MTGPVEEFVPDSAPLVTIAMPVLNGGALLAVAVESVRAQSFQGWELLIMDDGSTDGATEQVQHLQDKRIRVVRDGHNRGIASRLNQAIGLARGKYFARMDHDDICHPERIQKQVDRLNHDPAIDLLATRCLTMDESGRITGALPAELSHADICRRPWLAIHMAHPSWMGRIEWFRAHRYQVPAPYCAEDQELLLRAAGVSSYSTLPDFLLAYRIRSEICWDKLVKTRLTLAKVQVSWALEKARYLNAALSVVALAGRLLHDVYRYLATKFGQKRPSPTPLLERAAVAQWQLLIDALMDQQAKR